MELGLAGSPSAWSVLRLGCMRTANQQRNSACRRISPWNPTGSWPVLLATLSRQGRTGGFASAQNCSQYLHCELSVSSVLDGALASARCITWRRLSVDTLPATEYSEVSEIICSANATARCSPASLRGRSLLSGWVTSSRLRTVLSPGYTAAVVATTACPTCAAGLSALGPKPRARGRNWPGCCCCSASVLGNGLGKPRAFGVEHGTSFCLRTLGGVSGWLPSLSQIG